MNQPSSMVRFAACRLRFTPLKHQPPGPAVHDQLSGWARRGQGGDPPKLGGAGGDQLELFRSITVSTLLSTKKKTVL